MREKEAIVKQILVITDGCSNVGENPVDRALAAKKKGMTVNVIGVMDQGEMGRQGKEEAMSIADAGGGMCRIVHPLDLSATAQMMTHQTMQMTLHNVVNEQLLQVMGKGTEDLPPTERSKIMAVVDKLEEEITLHLVVAVDTSASMREKMSTVQEAIRDLSLSLQARSGNLMVAVIAFPGTGGDLVHMVHPLSSTLDMERLGDMFAARGGTPTAAAIDYAVQILEGARALTEDDYPDSRWTGEHHSM